MSWTQTGREKPVDAQAACGTASPQLIRGQLPEISRGVSILKPRSHDTRTTLSLQRITLPCDIKSSHGKVICVSCIPCTAERVALVAQISDPQSSSCVLGTTDHGELTRTGFWGCVRKLTAWHLNHCCMPFWENAGKRHGGKRPEHRLFVYVDQMLRSLAAAWSDHVVIV